MARRRIGEYYHEFLNRFDPALQRSIFVDLAVIGSYAIFTLLLLYSLPYDLTSRIPGDGFDGYENLWNLWWVKYSLTQLHTNPYITNYVYYPNGQELYFHTLSPLGGLLTIPFQDSLGLFFSYNLLTILAYSSGGVGAYHLAKYFTKDESSSYLAGIIFAFSPYHLAHTLGHLNLISFEGIPFYALFLFRLKDERRYRNSLYAAISLLITTFLGDFQYTFMLFIFTAFFIIFGIFLDRQSILNRKFAVRIILVPLIFILAAGMIFVPLAVAIMNNKYGYAQQSITDIETLSGDLVGFVVPNPENPLFHDYSQRIITTFVNFGAENRIFIGYTVLAALVYAISKNRKESKIWLLLTGTFLTFSLGPVLHVMGQTTFTVFTVNVPLPELIIHYLSGRIFRAPSRFAVLSSLGLGVLFAISFKKITDSNKMVNKYKILKSLLVVLLVFLILAEYNMGSYPMSYSPHVPEIYYQLGKMKEKFAVLDLPVNPTLADWGGMYMYYSTVSKKPIVEGYLSRTESRNIDMLYSIPLVVLADDLLKNDLDMDEKIIEYMNDINTQNSLLALRNSNVRFIIMHKGYFSSYALSTLTEYLATVIGAPYYADRDVIVFEYAPSVFSSSLYGFKSINFRKSGNVAYQRQSTGENATEFRFYPIISVTSDTNGELTVLWDYRNFFDGAEVYASSPMQYDGFSIRNVFTDLISGQTLELQLVDNRPVNDRGGSIAIGYDDIVLSLKKQDSEWHNFKSVVRIRIMSPSGTYVDLDGVLDENFGHHDLAHPGLWSRFHISGIR